MDSVSFGWLSDPLLLAGCLQADKESPSQGDNFLRHHNMILWQEGWDLPGTCQRSIFLLYRRGGRRWSQSGAEAMLAVPLKAQRPKLVFWFPDGFFASDAYRAPCARALPALRSPVCWEGSTAAATSSRCSGEEPLCAVIDAVK